MSETQKWTQEQREFHLEEYKSLRAEIGLHTTLMFNLFLGAVFISGSIVAWLLTYGLASPALPEGSRIVAKVLPAVLTLAFLIGGGQWFRILDRLISYLARLEERLAADDFGWQREQQVALGGPASALGYHGAMLGMTTLFIADALFAFFVG